MVELRRSGERGHANHGWLDSFHSFSFAGYHDPRHMGWGALRVINEDRVQAGQGFGTHGHRDMEIISYVLDGALGHRDSMGNGSTILPGDVQRLSAGSGMTHSEFNHERAAPTHFLQIWIEPDERGGAPSYEQRHFDAADKRGRLRVIASRDGRDGSVSIRQDALVMAGLFEGDESASHAIAAGRKGYVHVVRGHVDVNDLVLGAGDALKTEAGDIVIRNGDDAEVLVFDLPSAAG
ncbi:MAG: pirin family protein [Betaproteobacteria bacterium]